MNTTKDNVLVDSDNKVTNAKPDNKKSGFVRIDVDRVAAIVRVFNRALDIASECCLDDEWEIIGEAERILFELNRLPVEEKLRSDLVSPPDLPSHNSDSSK